MFTPCQSIGKYNSQVFTAWRFVKYNSKFCLTPVSRSVVLLILRMRLKELEMQIDLSTCANLNRTTDLKTGVGFISSHSIRMRERTLLNYEENRCNVADFDTHEVVV